AWQDAGPADGEPVGLEAHGFHELDVFLVAVDVLAGDAAGVAAADHAGATAELVPDALTSLAWFGGAFDLVAACGGAPDEIRRECACVIGHTNSVWVNPSPRLMPGPR